MHFGEHLMIDGYGGDFEKLNSERAVRECLDELTAKLGMKKLGEPVVYFAPDNTGTTPGVATASGSKGKDPGGWSGFVVIAESHISVHTFPKKGFLSADVYTCKNGLDRVLVTDYFRAKFGLREIEENFVKRGMKYGSL